MSRICSRSRRRHDAVYALQPPGRDDTPRRGAVVVSRLPSGAATVWRVRAHVSGTGWTRRLGLSLVRRRAPVEAPQHGGGARGPDASGRVVVVSAGQRAGTAVAGAAGGG